MVQASLLTSDTSSPSLAAVLTNQLWKIRCVHTLLLVILCLSSENLGLIPSQIAHIAWNFHWDHYKLQNVKFILFLNKEPLLNNKYFPRLKTSGWVETIWGFCTPSTDLGRHGSAVVSDTGLLTNSFTFLICATVFLFTSIFLGTTSLLFYSCKTQTKRGLQFQLGSLASAINFINSFLAEVEVVSRPASAIKKMEPQIYQN